MSSTYAIIMAGGVGSRFWPRSRKAQPKQFLNVFGHHTLIQNTVGRLQGLIPPEQCLVVTNADYVDETRKQLPALPPENILAEPMARNTGPCIAYAAAWLSRIDPDSTMVVLPADHVILDVARFQQILKRAVEVAREPDTLVTIGIEPTHPETGYGYIHYDPESASGKPPACKVRQFTEKPDEKSARRFLETGAYLWNSGMFIWRTNTIIKAFKQYQPIIYEAFEPLRGGDDRDESVVEAFEQCPKISIDYAVMEHADQVYVVPGSFGWNDVGDWRAVFTLQPKDESGNAVQGEALVLDSEDCLIQAGDRLVVLVGVRDVMVVDTADALLVCDRSSAQKVKDVTTYLTEHKPWFT